jgi:Tfp pilus assembly protein PilZ
MKILFATFTTQSEFLDALDRAAGRGAGVLSVQTKARYGAGEPVILEIGFPGLPNRVLVRAEYLAGSGECARFVLAEGEEHRRDFLLAVASGRANASLQRRHRRFPIRLPARLVAAGAASEPADSALAEIEDMGGGGIALKTSRLFPDGARVTVCLDPMDGSEDIHFAGRVVWHRETTHSGGMGIQFDRLGGDEMKRLRMMIRDVKLRGETRE